MDVGAILLDVGGVLLLPDPQLLGASLEAHEIPHDASALLLAHFGGVRHVDAAPVDWAAGGAPRRYRAGLAMAAGVPDERLDDAVDAFAGLFSRPSIEVWRRPTPWAHEGLRRLRALDRPVAVVSNSDGTVERQLEQHGLAQVGVGDGLDVAAVVDSAVAGVAKPDPEIFTPALDALGVPAPRCLYVGDTVTYDVVGARAAGLQAVHLDPHLACPDADHPHAPDLASAIAHVEG